MSCPLTHRPHRPRDAWKYANLYRNALEVVYYNNQTTGVPNNTVLIISPGESVERVCVAQEQTS